MNKKLIILAIVLGVFVICPGRGFSQAPYKEISGTARINGIIAPNAVVTVINTRRTFSRTTTADSRGFFKFSPLPVDIYTISATYNAFRGKMRRIIVGIGGSKVFDLEIDVDTKPGALVGKVTDKKEEPIKGASLTLAAADNPENKIEIEIDDAG